MKRFDKVASVLFRVLVVFVVLDGIVAIVTSLLLGKVVQALVFAALMPTVTSALTLGWRTAPKPLAGSAFARRG